MAVCTYATAYTRAAGDDTDEADNRRGDGGTDHASHHHCARRRHTSALAPPRDRGGHELSRPDPRSDCRPALASGGQVAMPVAAERPRLRGEGRVFLRGRIYWVAYCCRMDGRVREVRESAQTDDEGA